MIQTEKLDQEEWKRVFKPVLTLGDEPLAKDDLIKARPWTPEMQNRSTQVDNSFRELQTIENKSAKPPKNYPPERYKFPEVELGKAVIQAVKSPGTAIQRVMWAIDKLGSKDRGTWGRIR